MWSSHLVWSKPVLLLYVIHLYHGRYIRCGRSWMIMLSCITWSWRVSMMMVWCLFDSLSTGPSCRATSDRPGWVFYISRNAIGNSWRNNSPPTVIWYSRVYMDDQKKQIVCIMYFTKMHACVGEPGHGQILMGVSEHWQQQEATTILSRRRSQHGSISWTWGESKVTWMYMHGVGPDRKSVV